MYKIMFVRIRNLIQIYGFNHIIIYIFANILRICEFWTQTPVVSWSFLQKIWKKRNNFEEKEKNLGMGQKHKINYA